MMLEKAIALSRKGFFIHPLLPNEKTPAFKGWQTISTRDENLLKEWFSKPQRNGSFYNIGINCEKYGDNGEALVVLDMDMKAERKGELTVLKLELDNFLFPKTHEQKTPNNGKHFFYIAPRPVKSSHDAIGDGVEILSRGKQVVGAGSIVDGKEYTQNNTPISQAPEWLLNFNGNYKNPDPVEVRNNVDINEEVAIQRAMHRLQGNEVTVHEGSRNNRAFVEACFLKELGVSAPMTMKLMLEHWKCTPMLDLHELKNVVDSAFRNGNNAPGSLAPETFYSPIEENPDDEQFFLTEINKEYALVYIGANHFIIKETYLANGEKNVSFLSEPTFKRKLSAKYIQHKKGVTYYSDLWFKWGGRREYDRLCFLPEKEAGMKEYNLWQGFPLTPLKYSEASYKAQKSFDMYLSLLKDVITSGVEEHFNWLISYFAHLIQKPWEKPEITLVLKGEKGTGKNVSIRMIGELLGNSSYVETANIESVFGQYNQLLMSKLMVVLDEAFWGGDKSKEGTLKHYTTSPKITINAKFKDPIELDNMLRIVLIGNENWLVPASEDERRYAVFNVTNLKKQNHDFFNEMIEGMQEGGSRILFDFLKSWDLTDSNIRLAPKTKELASQKELSLQPLESFWLNCLKEGYFEEGIDWPNFLSKTQFRNLFYIYAKSKGIKSWLPDSARIGKSLMKICGNITSKRKRENECNTWFYTLPTLKEARDDFQKFIGHEIEWEEDGDENNFVD